ncbi:hypothetical protein C2855_21645 [Aeromonas bestiarum]|uniref:DUF6386 family protein n=1 Tax=Aeromonas bestiarum TaxID=105751 RepID=UPI000CD41034|nr:DUF6386 family protein [Aeromonas bestiarum]POG21189.1 hypothetical protein C2855_21645 [Aeromonas bestiarum]
MDNTFSISTDTATLSVFDLDAIKHRVSDTADWWSLPEDEVEEVNRGNIIFIGLGDDGVYEVNVTDHIISPDVTLFLRAPSGAIFIGAGEDTSGGDLEPDSSASISGRVLSLPIKNYAVSFKKDDNRIYVSFKPSEICSNNIKYSVKI